MVQVKVVFFSPLDEPLLTSYLLKFYDSLLGRYISSVLTFYLCVYVFLQPSNVRKTGDPGAERQAIVVYNIEISFTKYGSYENMATTWPM